MLAMLCAAVARPQAPPTAANQSAGATTSLSASPLRAKIDYLQANGRRKPPNPAPTLLTAADVNEYFAEPSAKMPRGIKSVHFTSSPGIVTAVAQVDFDEIRAGAHGNNSLLGLFQGRHEISAVARASGSHFHGEVDILSVTIDRVEVPTMLLELFVQRYVTPRYPGVGLETRFVMPSRVETAIVGTGKVTLIQR